MSWSFNSECHITLYSDFDFMIHYAFYLKDFFLLYYYTYILKIKWSEYFFQSCLYYNLLTMIVFHSHFISRALVADSVYLTYTDDLINSIKEYVHW